MFVISATISYSFAVTLFLWARWKNEDDKDGLSIYEEWEVTKGGIQSRCVFLPRFQTRTSSSYMMTGRDG